MEELVPVGSNHLAEVRRGPGDPELLEGPPCPC